MLWVELLGYAASLAVLLTFCMSTMVPLRILALASNVLFILYGYFGGLTPVLILHATLLPVNLYRLFQFQRLIRDMRNITGAELPMQSLVPYMNKVRLAAGETLVRKGDQADRLYYLADGELELTDFNKTLKPGAVVGEIGVFAPHHKRTATIVCRSDCTLFELTERKAKELYFQDRSFGFAVLQLITGRLIENNERLLQSGTA